MRLRAEIWAKAHLRRATSNGAIAMVLRKGDPDAGAIFIRTRRPDGTAGLYGPEPGSEDGLRHWRPLFAEGEKSEADIDVRLAREVNFDPDIWVIEIEDRQGRHFLGEFLAGA